jgi:uroporphyrinogen decarboxylase
MLPRDRQLATIRHEPTDRLSVDAICIENVPALADYLGIDAAQVADRLGLDGRLVAAGYVGPLPEPRGGVGWTEWQTPSTGDYGTARPYPLAGAASVGQINAFAWPDPAQYNYQQAAAAARAHHERYAVRGPYWRPLFCGVCDLLGMELAMQHMVAEPLLFEAVLDRVFEITFDYCRRFLDACGPALDILCLGDDFATQRGLMISPDQWRRFLKPRFAELFALGKRAGKPVWFHSCGDITSVLPDLLDLGVEVWETVQLHTLPLSPQELKREFGRHLTFFGGINTQRLPFVTPDEVKEEVRRCVRVLGEGGGYICGPDHHIKPDVPAANTVALFDAATQFAGR